MSLDLEEVVWDDSIHRLTVSKSQPDPEAGGLRPAGESFVPERVRTLEAGHEANGLHILVRDHGNASRLAQELDAGISQVGGRVYVPL